MFQGRKEIKHFYAATQEPNVGDLQPCQFHLKIQHNDTGVQAHFCLKAISHLNDLGPSIRVPFSRLHYYSFLSSEDDTAAASEPLGLDSGRARDINEPMLGPRQFVEGFHHIGPLQPQNTFPRVWLSRRSCLGHRTAPSSDGRSFKKASFRRTL